MPINGDQQLDRNQRRYGLSLDSCVGDDGPSPEQVTRISSGGRAANVRASGFEGSVRVVDSRPDSGGMALDVTTRGGSPGSVPPTSSELAAAYGRSIRKAGAQR